MVFTKRLDVLAQLFGREAYFADEHVQVAGGVAAVLDLAALEFFDGGGDGR